MPGSAISVVEGGTGALGAALTLFCLFCIRRSEQETVGGMSKAAEPIMGRALPPAIAGWLVSQAQEYQATSSLENLDAKHDPEDPLSAPAPSGSPGAHMKMSFANVAIGGRMAWLECGGYRYRFNPTDGSVWFAGPVDCLGTYPWRLVHPEQTAPASGGVTTGSARANSVFRKAPFDAKRG